MTSLMRFELLVAECQACHHQLQCQLQLQKLSPPMQPCVGVAAQATKSITVRRWAFGTRQAVATAAGERAAGGPLSHCFTVQPTVCFTTVLLRLVRRVSSALLKFRPDILQVVSQT